MSIGLYVEIDRIKTRSMKTGVKLITWEIEQGDHEYYTGCTKKKVRNAQFWLLCYSKIYHILISSDRTLSSEKNDTKIIEIWLSNFDSMVIFQKTVIINFLFILVTYQAGIMAFLTSLRCCPEAHWSVRTKQRENLWTAIPAVNSSRRFNKIRKWLCFKKLL